MLKHFLVIGYLPMAHSSGIVFGHSRVTPSVKRKQRYEQLGIEVPEPGEKRFLVLKGTGTISILVFDNLDTCLLIKAPSQRKAYLLANTLRAVLLTVFGQPAGESPTGEFLVELKRPLKPNMTGSDFVNSLRMIPERFVHDKEFLREFLITGTGLDHSMLARATHILSICFTIPRLSDAFQHLEHSNYLAYGLGPVYDPWVLSTDTRHNRQYYLEKQYFENRMKFDLAFLSAFRGIEALLGVNNVQSRDVKKQLQKIDQAYSTHFSTAPYFSPYKAARGTHRRWKYEELIQDLLVLRNAVAAHANPSAPYIIAEDEIRVIQHLARHMALELINGAKI